jgi:hypothetical protein
MEVRKDISEYVLLCFIQTVQYLDIYYWASLNVGHTLISDIENVKNSIIELWNYSAFSFKLCVNEIRREQKALLI